LEAASHAQHHHEMPTEGSALTGVAVSATLHCLTGCAIGEVSGMAIGTALGFSDLGTIVLAVALAFLFGYALTSLPLLRAGLALSVVVPIALASDTISIGTMEVIDNAIMLIVPGAMEASLSAVLFWGALSFALAAAFVVTVPVNRYLIARGKGHTAVHDTGIHGGPPTRLVGAGVIVAAVFGTAVVVAEIASSDDEGHGAAPMAADESGTESTHSEEMTMPATEEVETVRGLAASDDGFTLELGQSELPVGEPTELSFRVLGEDGQAVRDFQVEHDRRMHLILVRRDMVGFQHLHPRMSENGTWSTRTTIPENGAYRVFADFNHRGESETLGADVTVGGTTEPVELPDPSSTTTTAGGYEVELAGDDSRAGVESELAFAVTRDGEPVQVEPYLGADGHLVALREGDLAFLHVHPVGSEGHGGDPPGNVDAVRFMTEFPSEANYRLFLQFKHDGEVETAEFTREVTP
jgi:hypothetical protein